MKAFPQGSSLKEAPAGYKAAPGRKHAANLVGFFVTGGQEENEAYSPLNVIHTVKAGLPISELEKLQEDLGLPMDRLAPMLGISKATLHRRKAAGRLDASESDRVLRFARLLGKAAQVMESLPNARLWLAAPQISLGGAIPLEFAETELGAREVEDLLTRIEFGVYS